MQMKLVEFVKQQKILFITTKNIDYIRNVQEISILEREAAAVNKVYSNKKSYIGRLIEIWWKLLFCHTSDFDVIFIGFAPQLVMPFMWRFRKQKVIIDFFISVYDTLVNDRKKIAPNNLIAKFCHQIDCYVIAKADKVIVDTKADMEYFVQEFKGKQGKFEVLYLEADRKIYYPRKQEKEEGQKNKYIVLYFGSILPLQGIDIILETISLLKDRNDIWFQIIGPIPYKYRKPMQENVEYINWLSQENLATCIANADLCLAGHFNNEIEKAKRTIPGKAYIYCVMGKTMICGDNAANRELFTENEKVCFVPMGNAKKLKEGIEFMKEKSENAK